MLALWLVTLIWAFSFSLIGHFLSGSVDTWLAASTRALLAMLIFLPGMLRTGFDNRLRLSLIAVGAIQLGLMYVFFYASFAYLSVAEVALFTVFTPVWIVLLNDLITRSFRPMTLAAGALAVLAACVMRLTTVGEQWLSGFLLVQLANVCFAVGQVSYRHLANRHPELDRSPQALFGWFFAGALLVTSIGLLLAGDFQATPTTAAQWLVLLWLGLAASGLGYFFWNRSTNRVSVAYLAVMNNALIPAAILVNWTIWQQPLPVARFIPGLLLLGCALYLARCANRQRLTASIQ